MEKVSRIFLPYLLPRFTEEQNMGGKRLFIGSTQKEVLQQDRCLNFSPESLIQHTSNNEKNQALQ